MIYGCFVLWFHVFQKGETVFRRSKQLVLYNCSSTVSTVSISGNGRACFIWWRYTFYDNRIYHIYKQKFWPLIKCKNISRMRGQHIGQILCIHVQERCCGWLWHHRFDIKSLIAKETPPLFQGGACWLVITERNIFVQIRKKNYWI